MSFNLTRKTDYALVALSGLAEEAAGEGQARSARELAESYGLPASMLMNVLKELHRADILCSRRGVSGGYTLCRKSEEISLLEIIEAIEGPVKVAMCCDDEPNATEPCVACGVESRCPIVTPMQRFDDMVRQFLQGVKLADLIGQDHKAVLSQIGGLA
jgi:Rrf2 family protein